MNINFFSYFVIGFVLLAVILAIFAIGKFRLFHLAIKNLLKNPVLSVCLIIALSLPFILITSSLLINDSIARSKQKYIQAKVSGSTGFVYSRSEETVWNKEKIDAIIDSIKPDFEHNLPLLYKTEVVKDLSSNKSLENVILLNFSPEEGGKYDDKLSEIDLNVNEEEVIVSRSIANTLSLSEGDEISIKEYSFKVKKVVEDNGYIGFNAPLSSKYFIPQGSVYLNRTALTRFFSQIDKKTEFYNGVLLRRDGEYEARLLKSITQERLNAIDRNILFDEFQQSLFYSLDEATNGLNIGQTVLLISIIPLVASLALCLVLMNIFFIRRVDQLISLKSLGYKKSDIVYYFIFESVFYLTLAGGIGVLISILLNKFFLSILKNLASSSINRFDYNQILRAETSTNSLIFAFTGAWLILFLSILLWSIRRSGFDAGSAIKGLHFGKEDKWSSRKLMGIFAVTSFTVVVLYFVLNSKLTGGDLREVTVFLSINILIWTAAYGLKYRFNKSKIILVSVLFTLILTFLFSNIFSTKALWQSSPVFYYITIIVYILSSIFFVVSLLPDLGSVVSKIFPDSSFSKFTGLSLGTFSSNSTVSFVFISLITLLVIFTSIGNSLNTSLASISQQNFAEGFDATVFDELGVDDISIKLNAEDFSPPVRVSYGGVALPQFRYESIPEYDSSVFKEIPKDAFYRSQISVLDRDILERQELKGVSQKAEILDSFYGAEKYVILGENYSKDSSQANLRPNINIGDEIEIQFFGNITVKRKVIGIIKKTNSTGVFDSSLFLQNGILLSPEDYHELNKSNSVFLENVYGINFSNKSASQNGKLFDSLKDTSVSKIIVKTNEIQRGLALKNTLIKIAATLLILTVIILAIIYALLIQTKSNRNSNIFTKISEILGYLFVIIVGIFIGWLFLLILNQKDRNLVLDSHFLSVISAIILIAFGSIVVLANLVIKKKAVRDVQK